jgi:hypothetical protein
LIQEISGNTYTDKLSLFFESKFNQKKFTGYAFDVNFVGFSLWIIKNFQSILGADSLSVLDRACARGVFRVHSSHFNRENLRARARAAKVADIGIEAAIESLKGGMTRARAN